MTVSGITSEPTTQGTGARRDWVRPSFQQLSAGSAENQSGPATDNITNPS